MTAAVRKIAHEVALVLVSAWLAMLVIGAIHRVLESDPWGYWTCVAAVTLFTFVHKGLTAFWRELRHG